MIKITLASLAVFSCIGLSQAGFKDGPCGKAEVTFDGLYGRVQCDYKLKASQRYKLEDGVHKLWAYYSDTNQLPS